MTEDERIEIRGLHAMMKRKRDMSGLPTTVDEKAHPKAFYDGDRFLIATAPCWRTVIVNDVEYMEEIQLSLYSAKMAEGWTCAGHTKINDVIYWVMLESEIKR